MSLIEIQKRVVITQKDVDRILDRYKKMRKTFHLCFGEFSGDRDDIIREIKQLTDVGKEILMMDYRFEKWMKKEKI